MSLKAFLKKRMDELGISPKKSLGQNFLIQESVVEKIVGLTVEADSLIEVGPGLGSLTESLLSKGHMPKLIELDRDLAAYWASRGLDVMEGDALKMDWGGLNLPEGSLFVSNLPYQISARIVVDRSVGPGEISQMILMFQKEVAQRVKALPRTKAYGFLSVVAQLSWEVRVVADVGPSGFFPPPEVDSRVLHFKRKRALPQEFVSFVKKAFSQRRKKMLKAFPGEKTILLEALKSLGYSENVRAEELRPQDFWELYGSL